MTSEEVKKIIEALEICRENIIKSFDNFNQEIDKLTEDEKTRLQ
jgi:hypothetical protein